MLVIRILLASILCMSAGALFGQVVPSTFDFTPVDALIGANLPDLGGGAVLLVEKDGREIHRKAYGTHQDSSVVPIASATKWLSAAVIMALVDDGKLSLDDTAGRFFPNLTGDKARMTVRQMFSHTSGLPGGEGGCLNDRTTTLAACAEEILARPMEAPPGTRFCYGGSSMQVAGRIAEIASGKSWTQLFNEKIAAPLGMRDTDYNGLGVTTNPRIAGGARSSIADYGAFLRMVAGQGMFGGKRVLSAASVAEMQKDQTAGAPIACTPYDTYAYLDPSLPSTRYGIGEWRERVEPGSGRLLDVSSQGAFGFSPWIDHERGVAGVLLVFSRLTSVMPTYIEMKRRIRQIVPATAPALVLSNGRVEVSVSWRSQYSGQTGTANPIPKGDAFGYFHFSDPENPEVFVKVLDFGAGKPYLLFWAGLTDFEYTVTFTSRETGKSVAFTKPAGKTDGGADNTALVSLGKAAWDGMSEPLSLLPEPKVASEYVVAPAATDPAISQALEDHYAYVDRSIPPTGELFVFFPGTGGIPRYYRLIVQEAARNGFHGIGLRYPNAEAVGDLCRGNAGPDCHAKVRQEILEGRDVSPLVAVERADSIENRLIKLLQYLEKQHPGEGWGGYVRDGKLDWSRIRTAGHSQGAGHAAFIAKDRAVAGVSCFGGPGDWDTTRLEPASWVKAPHVTPVERYFLFNHLRDELVPWLVVRANAASLGLDPLGAPESVDTASPPYGGTHQFSTDLPKPGVILATFHNMTAVDVHTPKAANGSPAYLPVWRTASFWRSEKKELLLSGGAVSVTVSWRSQYSGVTGTAQPLPQGDNFGFFWFSDASNPEVFVKVLDFGADRPYLLFAAGLTDFEYTATYTNVKTGEAVTFTKPAGSYLGFADGTALAH